MSQSLFDFYRCGKCNGLVTKPEMIRCLDETGRACRCGALKFFPTNPQWWEFFLPRVWKFAFMRIRRLA